MKNKPIKKTSFLLQDFNILKFIKISSIVLLNTRSYNNLDLSLIHLFHPYYHINLKRIKA